MYKALNRLSKRDWKAPRSTTITVEQFRDHFDGITRDRYEELPRSIAEVVSQVRDLKGERAGLARKMRTVEQRVLSDHKPKMLEVRIDPRRWRAQGGGG